MKTKKQKTLAELKKDLELISKKELTQIVGGKKDKSQLSWTIKCGGLTPQ
ncbi:MAG: bacteriocin [Saprospiraceae bacterium]|jgi:bacteriocin-like protein|nr:bacteriocin [Saprospiraceae bacterium]